MKKRITCFLIALLTVLSSTVIFAESDSDIQSNARRALQNSLDSVYTNLKSEGPAFNDEWLIIALARAGYSVDNSFFAKYYSAVEKYAAEKIAKVSVDGTPNALDKNKSTENSRLITALASIGSYSTNVSGNNLLSAYSSFDWTKHQGHNGVVWALIAVDSIGYETEDANFRQSCIDYILSRQIADGGFSLSKQSDPDVTAMTLIALAKYKDQPKVKEACDKAIEWLSANQKDDGTYSSWGVINAESSAQVLVALCTWGIDPLTDSRFIKNNHNLIEVVLSYAIEDSTHGYGFEHTKDGGYSAAATEQALLGLTAYFRMLDGKTNLYDMSDVTMVVHDPKKTVDNTKKETSIPIKEDVPDSDSKKDVIPPQLLEKAAENYKKLLMHIFIRNRQFTPESFCMIPAFYL